MLITKLMLSSVVKGTNVLDAPVPQTIYHPYCYAGTALPHGASGVGEREFKEGGEFKKDLIGMKASGT